MARQIAPEVAALIKATVDTGMYRTADEFMETMLDQFQGDETKQAIRTAWVKRQLELSEEGGGAHSVEEVFSELRSELESMNDPA